MMSVTQIFSARAILIQSRSTSCPSASVATTRKAGHCLCRSREPNVSRQRPMKSRSLRMACSGVPSYHNSGAPETAGVNPFVAPPAELMLDCRNVLGESPVWCTRRNLLYWVDIEEQHLHSFDPLASAPEGHQWWPLPDRPGCVALTETDGRFILAFKGGVSVWEQETEKITQLAAFEPDFPTTRMNDGRADRDGRLVVGGYNEAHSIDGGRAIASLYRLGTDGGVSRVLPEGIRCANSICFSPDGRHMYFTDSPTRTILRYDYPPPHGDIPGVASGTDPLPCNPRVFARMAPDDPAIPDGSTTDAEGGLWNARFRGSQVVHHRASDGAIDVIIPVPVPNVTSVALGGPDLKTLFITTARKKMSEGQLALMPSAGGLFAARVPGAPGLPEPRCHYDRIH
eukprot:jgi/Mesvir1/15160/Mv04843-RA.1